MEINHVKCKEYTNHSFKKRWITMFHLWEKVNGCKMCISISGKANRRSEYDIEPK